MHSNGKIPVKKSKWKWTMWIAMLLAGSFFIAYLKSVASLYELSELDKETTDDCKNARYFTKHPKDCQDAQLRSITSNPFWDAVWVVFGYVLTSIWRVFNHVIDFLYVYRYVWVAVFIVCAYLFWRLWLILEKKFKKSDPNIFLHTFTIIARTIMSPFKKCARWLSPPKKQVCHVEPSPLPPTFLPIAQYPHPNFDHRD